MTLGYLFLRRNHVANANDGKTHSERLASRPMEFGALVSPSSPRYEELRKRLYSLCGEKLYPRLFSEPVALRSNQGLSTLGRHMFWAHEASLDAEQCLLLVLNEGSYFFLRNPEDSQNPLVLLVDKSSIFFPTYGDLTKHQHQTLLDGEFVYSYTYSKSVFYVHDAVCVNGKKASHLPLSQRLELFRDQFMQPLRMRYPEADEASLPFVVMGKIYAPLDRLSTLFSCITQYQDPAGARFVYKNGKRYNENKGLVFVSEAAPYCPSTRLEWLWPELFPVVFRLNVEDVDCFSLSLIVPRTDKVVPYRTTSFELDSDRLLDDLKDVTECNIACLHVNGEFRYLYIAGPEKCVSSVMDVLKYMEEVTTTVTKIDLEKLAESVTLLKARRSNSNASSPTLTKSPLPSFSPEVEVIPESPVVRTDSGFSHLKRPLGESEEELHEAKRRRTALTEH